MKTWIAIATLLMLGALASAQVPGKTLQETKKSMQPMTGQAQAADVNSVLPKPQKKARKPAAKAEPAMAKSPFGGKAATAEGKAEGEAPKPDMAAKAAGRRDPFLSPVRKGTDQPKACTGGGKHCLEIGQLVLRGIVKTGDGYIALVAIPAGGGANVSERAYFLRQNDPVYNGYVLRITNTEIVFRENVVDKLGKTSQRDVVKTVSGGESKS